MQNNTLDSSLRSPRMKASKKSERSKLEFRHLMGDKSASAQLQALKKKMK